MEETAVRLAKLNSDAPINLAAYQIFRAISLFIGRSLSGFLFSAFLFFFHLKTEAQIDSLYVLVGETDRVVIDYFKYLNDQKPNEYFEIKRSTSDWGDLELSADFGIFDQPFFKCLWIFTRFERVNKNEICTGQIIYGKIEYADFFLAFIKDNYRFVRDNTWETEFNRSAIPAKVVAEFKKFDDGFALAFTLERT